MIIWNGKELPNTFELFKTGFKIPDFLITVGSDEKILENTVQGY